jgi:hypothetical protein
MDWKIFCKPDIELFVKEAAFYNLFPIGDMIYSAKDKAVNCGGKQYTFAWLVLRKLN